MCKQASPRGRSYHSVTPGPYWAVTRLVCLNLHAEFKPSCNDRRIITCVPTLPRKAPLGMLPFLGCDSPGKVTTWGQDWGRGSHLKAAMM